MSFFVSSQTNFTDGFEPINLKDNIDNNTPNLNINLNLNLDSQSSSYSGGGGGNKSMGPAMILGGLIFSGIGILGGTLGADYEGSGNTKKPFYKQGAHFATALSGALMLVVGVVITLN